jgi:hypothetical protein
MQNVKIASGRAVSYINTARGWLSQLKLISRAAFKPLRSCSAERNGVRGPAWLKNSGPSRVRVELSSLALSDLLGDAVRPGELPDELAWAKFGPACGDVAPAEIFGKRGPDAEETEGASPVSVNLLQIFLDTVRTGSTSAGLRMGSGFPDS